MSSGIGSKITIKPEEDFFYALKNATTEFLPDSTIQDNTTLEKYIFEPISPIKKFTLYNFEPLLSKPITIKEFPLLC